MKITILALTYKRPEGLARLIGGLDRLTFSAEPPEVTIVIVDNDPDGSARQACERFASEIRWPLKHVVETQRGIAFARNAALDNAGDAEWLCFLDDDEVPEPCWLDELIRVQREYDADVVTGPPVPYFPDPVPEWIVKGDFAAYRRFATGERRPVAYTHNVMFRARILTELDLRFDVQWALMGCEDHHFFEQIGRAGYKIIWSDEAVVTEWFPQSRANARWVLQRGYRYGNTTTCVERDLYPDRRPHLYVVVRAVKRIVRGMLLLPFSWLFGRHIIVRELRHICYGIGMLTGWLGWRYEEYRETHGT